MRIMLEVTVVQSNGRRDKGPPEPLSPAAASLSCQGDMEGVFIIVHNALQFPLPLLLHHSSCPASYPEQNWHLFTRLSTCLQSLSVVLPPCRQQHTAHIDSVIEHHQHVTAAT